MDNIWEKFKGDFNAMTDEEIEEESQSAQDLVDEGSDWLDAVASWEAAGRPRSSDGSTP